jgi:hypothetical protein
MGSIIVPPRIGSAIWRQNLCQTLLLLAHKITEEGGRFTLELARDYVQFKARLDELPLPVVTQEVERAFRWLKERGILVPDGEGFKVAPIADLRAVLEQAGDAPVEITGGAGGAA